MSPFSASGHGGGGNKSGSSCSSKKKNDSDNKSKKKQRSSKKRDDDDDPRKKKSSSSSNSQAKSNSSSNQTGSSKSSGGNYQQSSSKPSSQPPTSKEIVEAKLPSDSKPSKNQVQGTTFVPFGKGRIDSDISLRTESQETEKPKLVYSAEEILQATRTNDIALVQTTQEEQPSFEANSASTAQIAPGESNQGLSSERVSLFDKTGASASIGARDASPEKTVDDSKNLPTDPWIYHLAQNSKESVVEQLKANPSMRESLRKRIGNMKLASQNLNVREKEYLNFMTTSLEEADQRASQKEEKIVAASEKEFFASINAPEGLTPNRMIAELENQHEPWMDRTEPLFERVSTIHKKIVREGRL